MELKDVIKIIEEEMVKSANYYAKEDKDNTNSAYAIFDTYLCVKRALEQGYK